MNDFWYLDKFVYCEFIVSYLCNNSCPYCFWYGNLKADAFMFREKGPWLPRNSIAKALLSAMRKHRLLSYADAFRNYPADVWKELFAAIFKDKIVYLSFTGGEPLIYHKNLADFIRVVADVSEDFVIRVDTNGSIVPDFPEGLRQKITYNVSYHRSQIDRDIFLNNLDGLSKQGRVLMINRIIHHEEEMAEAVQEERFFASRGFFLNINPAFFAVGNWSKENLALLKKVTHPTDYGFKIEKRTKGRQCRYPIFGFQLLPSGYAWVPPCDTRTVNLVRTKRLEDVLIRRPIQCPSANCVCLHQYSFIDGVPRNAHSYDILDTFVKDHLAHRRDRTE